MADVLLFMMIYIYPNFRTFFSNLDKMIKETKASGLFVVFPYHTCKMGVKNFVYRSEKDFSETYNREMHMVYLTVKFSAKLVVMFTKSFGAPVAQWVKRWPTDLAVVSSRPA